MVALAERLCALSGAGPRVLLQLRRGGRRGRDQARAPHGPGARRARQAPDRVRRGRVPRPHARRRSRRAGRPPSASRSSPCRPASSTCRATTSTRSRRPSGPTPAPCWSSRSRARAASGRSTPRWLRARARALRPPRRAAAATTRCRPASAAAARGSARSSPACGPTRSRSPRASRGGLPIGALLARDLPDTGFERGDHATTFGGSPPIAAAALAVLDAIEREGLVENAACVGEHIAARAAGAARRRPRARRRSAAGNRARRAPRRPRSPTRCGTRGILVNAITPTALRLVPPLCLTEAEADRFCASLEDVLAARRDQHATTVA